MGGIRIGLRGVASPAATTRAAGARTVASAPPRPRLAAVVPLRRTEPQDRVADRPAELAGPAEQPDTIVDIYQAEHLALFRFVRAATGDDEAAEDVLQEAFVRLIREVAAGRRPDNAHAWLFRVATNLVVSQVRRARTAERHLADLDRDPLAASPEQLVLRTERDEEVRVALDDLPTDARVALLLAARGFSGREIAHTLGRTEGAVRTLLCRSRLRVRERLDAERTRVEGAAG
jgi:RNA polymerase sigma factor (sigma-70 family)